MKIFEARELNEKERFTLEFFIGCLDGNVSFALIGERVIVALEDVGPSDGESALREAMKTATDAILSASPDFNGIVTENGFGIVTVGRAGIVSKKKLTEKELQKRRMDMGRMLSLRGEALEGCRKPELIAAAFPA